MQYLQTTKYKGQRFPYGRLYFEKAMAYKEVANIQLFDRKYFVYLV